MTRVFLGGSDPASAGLLARHRSTRLHPTPTSISLHQLSRHRGVGLINPQPSSPCVDFFSSQQPRSLHIDSSLPRCCLQHAAAGLCQGFHDTQPCNVAARRYITGLACAEAPPCRNQSPVELPFRASLPFGAFLSLPDIHIHLQSSFLEQPRGEGAPGICGLSEVSDGVGCQDAALC